MDLFHIIDDGAAILRSRGRYTQQKIFRRGEDIYALAGKDSYVKLIKGNGTSDPNITWVDVAGPNVTSENRHPMWIKPVQAKPAPKSKSSFKVVRS